MAVKCPICGAENPEGKTFCGDCGTRMPERTPDEPVSPIPQQWDALKARWYSIASPSTTRKLIVVAIVLMVVASALAYYYQPVRGTGSASRSTVVRGGIVEFDFTPSQGVAPYGYSWSFGDGNHSSEKNPTHRYSTIGTYTVTVTVADKAGIKCHWATTITVRAPLVFIDTVQVTYFAILGMSNNTPAYYNLWVDGVLEVHNGARSGSYIIALQPGTTHEVKVQVGNMLYQDEVMVLASDKGSITTPTTEVDLHCILWYETSGNIFTTENSTFTLLPV